MFYKRTNFLETMIPVKITDKKVQNVIKSIQV